jgi:two-component SAPR family response regulator
LQPNQEPTSKVEQEISFNNRLLLVDEESDTISHKRWFEANGFEVHAFHDPSLTLSNFKPGIYGLLLIDVKMPQINGFELYEKIKKIDSEVKACFNTAHEVYYESLREIFPTTDLDRGFSKPRKGRACEQTKFSNHRKIYFAMEFCQIKFNKR